mgnify:CR=1 FL=1
MTKKYKSESKPKKNDDNEPYNLKEPLGEEDRRAEGLAAMVGEAPFQRSCEIKPKKKYGNCHKIIEC